jgi:hypothetical protein
MLGYLALVIEISDNSIVALAAMLLTVLAILRLAWEKLADLVAHIWTACGASAREKEPCSIHAAW